MKKKTKKKKKANCLPSLNITFLWKNAVNFLIKLDIKPNEQLAWGRHPKHNDLKLCVNDVVKYDNKTYCQRIIIVLKIVCDASAHDRATAFGVRISRHIF